MVAHMLHLLKQFGYLAIHHERLDYYQHIMQHVLDIHKYHLELDYLSMYLSLNKLWVLHGNEFQRLLKNL